MAYQREDLIPNATPPTEEDSTYREEDYVIGATDVVDITIMDLFSVGAESSLRREVSDAGYIDLPLLPSRIKANGLTQEGLKDAIKSAYSPNILRDPVVSVAVVARRQNTFSLLGSAARVGTYSLLRKDMRMLEALALGGDVTSYTVKYIYVFRLPRATPVGGDSNQPAAAGKGAAENLGALPSPVAPGEIPVPPSAPASKAAVPDELQGIVPGPGRSTAPAGGLPAPSVVTALDETSASAPGAGARPDEEPSAGGKAPRWVYSNGKWIRVEPAPAPAPGPVAGESKGPAAGSAEANNPFEVWRKLETNEGSRVIAVNFKSLMNGEKRSNIVIRDNDVIYVPREEVGEFYVMGEVQRPGVYSLTGRQITVKMAIAAAGNLGVTSWPQNSILIRRVGENQEQMIPLDVEAIFHAQATDLFLKPNDVLAVGSNWRQPFMAVLRNAFRFTYGFGFVYDRNFDTPAVGSPGLDSRRFTRW
jgi:protein involved in polysaccharide export with SLBB domain